MAKQNPCIRKVVEASQRHEEDVDGASAQTRFVPRPAIEPKTAPNLKSVHMAAPNLWTRGRQATAFRTHLTGATSAIALRLRALRSGKCEERIPAKADLFVNLLLRGALWERSG